MQQHANLGAAVALPSQKGAAWPSCLPLTYPQLRAPAAAAAAAAAPTAESATSHHLISNQLFATIRLQCDVSVVRNPVVVGLAFD